MVHPNSEVASLGKNLELALPHSLKSNERVCLFSSAKGQALLPSMKNDDDDMLKPSIPYRSRDRMTLWTRTELQVIAKALAQSKYLFNWIWALAEICSLHHSL